ncbi:MAG: hypothetical protein K6F07_03125 [Bacilli bacterium]|nr:hypothetical protein [Bacilli bacterium]
MFKESMKAFFKNLRLIVIPMAFIYLGAIIWGVLALEGVFKGINNFSTTLKSVADTSGGSISINISNFINGLSEETGFDPESMKIYFDNFIKNLKLTSEGAINQLQNSASAAITDIILSLVLGFVIFVLLFIIGAFVTGLAVRRDAGIKAHLGKFILRGIFRGLVFIAAAVGIYYLLNNNIAPWLSAVIVLLFIALDCFLTFSFSYWLHRGKSGFKYREVIRFRDVVVYFLTILLLFIGAIAIGVGIFFLIGDPIIAIIIVIPFIVITLQFFGNYIETFVMRKITLLSKK